MSNSLYPKSKNLTMLWRRHWASYPLTLKMVLNFKLVVGFFVLVFTCVVLCLGEKPDDNEVVSHRKSRWEGVFFDFFLLICRDVIIFDI